MITKNINILRKLPTVLYKTAAQLYIDKNFPRHIFIETTASCQLSCEYCPREKKNDHMEWSLFKEIINECSKYGPRSFSLHLFGEPLLYPKIVEAINYIKQKNRRHTILLTTNGLLLNKFAKLFLSSGPDRIIWSYRKNNFNNDSLLLLKKKGLIRLLIEETPKEEFEKWKTFPRVEIKHLHNYGGNIDVEKWGLETKPENRYPCYHLWLAPAVRWNGDITICCADPHGQEVLGNYSSDSLSLFRAWHLPKLLENRESHKIGQYKGLCKDCNVWKTYPDIFFEFQKKNGHPAANVL